MAVSIMDEIYNVVYVKVEQFESKDMVTLDTKPNHGAVIFLANSGV